MANKSQQMGVNDYDGNKLYNNNNNKASTMANVEINKCINIGIDINTMLTLTLHMHESIACEYLLLHVGISVYITTICIIFMLWSIVCFCYFF